MPRIVIDITTLARWRGPPVGIPRVVGKYAHFAFDTIPGAIFTLFDPEQRAFRTLSPESVSAILEGMSKVDLSVMPDATGNNPHTLDRIPGWLRAPFLWVTRPRRKLLAALEQARLALPSGFWRDVVRAAQSTLLSERSRGLYFRDDGSRIDVPSLDRISGPALVLAPEDIVVQMQYDWLDTDIGLLEGMMWHAGALHVVLCHDIIPLQWPQWYSQSDVAGFRAYYDRAFARADRMIFTTRSTATCAAEYCRQSGLALPDHTIVPLGSDLGRTTDVDGELPATLTAGRYVLFVSTLEPRKNHRLLVDAWRRLVADGTIDATGFKLVFAGRTGWMINPLIEALRTDPALASIVHLADVDDETLLALYRGAAFCVYPPEFEGFGLPAVEALAFGKAMIVSDRGPLPELVGDFALCLDPEDLEAWTETLRRWVTGSPERDRYEARAKADYRPLSWNSSAERFYDAVLSAGRPASGQVSASIRSQAADVPE